MPDYLLYGVVIPFGVFGLETLILAVWLYKTSEPKPKQNKLTKKGKSNG